jgi:hypothetical protein
MDEINNIEDYRLRRYETSQDLADRIAFRIYQGDAGELAQGINEMNVLVEFNRATAVHAFAELLRRKLMGDGYVVISDIDDAENGFFEDEVLDYGDNVRMFPPPPIESGDAA